MPSEGGAVSGFDWILPQICSGSCKYIKVSFTCCLCKRKLLGIVSVGFDEMGQLLILYFGFVRYLKNTKGITMTQCIEFKEAHDLVRLEVSLDLISP